jgi:hypothetical protein
MTVTAKILGPADSDSHIVSSVTPVKIEKMQESFQMRGRLELHERPAQNPLSLHAMKLLRLRQSKFQLNKRRVYQAGVDSECSLDATCGIIARECNQTLSPENKLSCVYFAIAMTTAFAILGVPYSVIVFAEAMHRKCSSQGHLCHHRSCGRQQRRVEFSGEFPDSPAGRTAKIPIGPFCSLTSFSMGSHPLPESRSV